MLVSTSTLGGHVNTISTLPSAGRPRRRFHSDEFKADAVAAASQPGMSLAAVALARGVNANLLRRWVREAEVAPVKIQAKAAPGTAAFIPVQLPNRVAHASDIRIDVRRGATTVTVVWPLAAAAECASWMRELLR